MEYLIRRDSYFYFRMRVPIDLQVYFSSNVIKKSLRTKKLKHAKILVKTLSFKTEKLFTIIRGNMLTDEQIKKLISEYLQKTLNETEEARASGIGLPRDEEELTEHLETFSMLESDYKEDLAFNKLKNVEGAIDDILEEHSIDIEKGSLEYKKLCRELLKASVVFLSTEKKRLVGDYENEASFGFPSATLQSNGKPSKLLSEVVDEYIREKKLKDKWSKKTEDEYLSIFKVFSEMIQVFTEKEDIEFRAIEKDTMLQYVDALTKFPANIKKKREFRDKTVSEILQFINEHSPEPMGIKTRNKKIELISSLFKWAIKQGYAERNLAEGLAAKEDRKEDEERKVYSKKDLQKLISSPVYTTEIDTTHAERFWIPLIALFTGMRLEEICQLYLEDIREIEGIWCFDINNKKDKKLKTSSSERIVPVHSVLVNIGFIKYVKSLTGKTRLWENLERKRDSYSKDFGRWFQRYNRIHITEDRQKVFHSFRHTFTDNLKQQGVSDTVISELVGHSHGSITMGRYGKKYKPDVLLKAVKKLDYGVDLQKLRTP